MSNNKLGKKFKQTRLNFSREPSRKPEIQKDYIYFTQNIGEEKRFKTST